MPSYPQQLRRSTPSFNSRVISLSSAAHRHGTINFDDLNFEHTEYSPFSAYCQSKLANAYFANEVDRSYQSQGLRAFSVHPGGIITHPARHLPSTKELEEHPVISKLLQNPAHGASTTVWAAIAKELEGKGGFTWMRMPRLSLPRQMRRTSWVATEQTRLIQETLG
ncbi:hypothetical protein GGR54DRAFT_237686 [Hypoxylon sp. NC1633]|nr:hypothetical protein GGR54DRAFT_237686 [Hypoxylon sp. NC1633]